ncbi:hypothetical protein ACB092_01G137800 [Castanea dentata]
MFINPMTSSLHQALSLLTLTMVTSENWLLTVELSAELAKATTLSQRRPCLEIANRRFGLFFLTTTGWQIGDQLGLIFTDLGCFLS